MCAIAWIAELRLRSDRESSRVLFSLLHNGASQTARRFLALAQRDVGNSLARLSSGRRINRASDDAAGLAIGTKFRAQVRSVQRSILNASDAISYAQVAEGALAEVSAQLIRMRELAIQAANGTVGGRARESLQLEVDGLLAEFDRVLATTRFNGFNPFEPGAESTRFQIGPGANDGLLFEPSTLNPEFSDYATQGVASTSVAGTASRFATESLTIDGPTGSAPVSVTAGDSAADVAAAINATTGTTDVSATATTGTTLGFSVAAQHRVEIRTDQGIHQAEFTLTGTSGAGLQAAIDEINLGIGATGVVASLSADGNNVELTQADGENIVVADYGLANPANIQVGGVGGATLIAGNGLQELVAITGSVSLSSSGPYSITGAVAGSTFATAAASSTYVSDLPVSTLEEARDALAILDDAIAQVSAIRGSYGSATRRVESAIRSLRVTEENTAAAESRIMDADFAEETAQLTRSQILREAGIAVLSQANSQANTVLSLLENLTRR